MVLVGGGEVEGVSREEEEEEGGIAVAPTRSNSSGSL